MPTKTTPYLSNHLQCITISTHLTTAGDSDSARQSTTVQCAQYKNVFVVLY